MQDRVAIPRPCSKRWAELRGDGRARFCETCQTPVHAIGEYSPQEWDELMRTSGGHVCGLLTGESAPEPRTRRAVLVGALLTAISPLMAQTGRVRIVVKDISQAVVPRANVSLLSKDDKVVRSITADERGEAAWNDLPMGDVRFRVEMPGFKHQTVTITAQGDKEIRKDVVLELGVMGEVVTIQEKR